jgi:hypothetical protein
VPPKLPPPACGLIDATSNAGGGAGDCAWLRGAFRIPIATGRAKAAMPVVVNKRFLAEFKFRAMECVGSGRAISICKGCP